MHNLPTMILSSNHRNSGFSLLEALIATLMIGVLLSSLFGLHTISFNSVVKLSAQLSRLILMKQELQQAHRAYAQNKDFPNQEKKIEIPTTTIQFTTKKISDASTLKKFEHAQILHIRATWDYRGRPVQETFISFKQNPPPKEEKAKKT